MKTEPNILLTPTTPRTEVGHAAQGWRWLSWFSLILALAGLGDWILAWLPMRFGIVEWEFGTIVSTFSGLPLITMGFAGIIASSAARGIRWQVIGSAIAVLLFATWILAAFVVFLLDIPVALAAVQGIARLGIIKAIAKTSLLAVLFSLAYVITGVSALRFARRLRGI